MCLRHYPYGHSANDAACTLVNLTLHLNQLSYFMSKKPTSSKTSKNKKKQVNQRRFGFRFSDAKVSTILMSVLLTFMALIIAVGAVGAWFAKQSLDQMIDMNAQDRRASFVMDLNNDIMVTRVNLLTAARLLQEAEIEQSFSLRERAIDTIGESVALLDLVRSRFTEFRAGMSDVSEIRSLENRLIAAFQQYVDDGIEPMIHALNAGDYTTFYFVNSEYGISRAETFLSAVHALTGAFSDRRAAFYDQAQVEFKQALITMAGCILIGLILVIVMRMVFQRTVVRRLSMAQTHFDHIANGDLTHRIEIGARNEIGALYEAMRRMQEGLTRVVSEVRSGVEEITVGSRQIFVGNTDLSSRTEQQAASLQETAASMEELDSTVRQNTDNASQADSLAANAAEVATRGGAAVSAVVNTMHEISTSSNQMSEIVSVIDGIAFQTNILALNAAVEAARAGEQGRGFAVVAGEVRSLAQRSAQAAREIKQLIDESMVKVGQGAGRADEAGRVMEEVVNAIQGVSTIMAEISSASHEQADGIGQVNLAITEMDSVVQQNAALVEEAAAAAGSLQTQATRLHEAVAAFRVSSTDVIDVAMQEQQRLDQQAYDASDADDHRLEPYGVQQLDEATA